MKNQKKMIIHAVNPARLNVCDATIRGHTVGSPAKTWCRSSRCIGKHRRVTCPRCLALLPMARWMWKIQALSQQGHDLLRETEQYLDTLDLRMDDVRAVLMDKVLAGLRRRNK